MVEAGIALARGYEGVGTESAKQKADLIYKAIGSKHPMSATLPISRLVRGQAQFPQSAW